MRFAHAPGMLGAFPRHWLQRKPLVSDADMHHGTCVSHVPRCMSGSLIHGGGEKDSRRIRKPQFYVSDKRTIVSPCTAYFSHHYSDVTLASWRLNSPTTPMFVQQLVLVDNIKAESALHASLEGNPPATGRFFIKGLVMRNAFPWASCQMNKIAGCACAGNAGNVFPAAAG